LIKGPVIERHGKLFYLSSKSLFFEYTFAPGSVVSLNITSGENKMKVFYKKNETIVKKNEVLSNFELSFTETSFTSYFIEVSTPDPDVSSEASYDFVAETMTFNMSDSEGIGEETHFDVAKGQVLLFSRNMSQDRPFHEYVPLKIFRSEAKNESFQFLYLTCVVLASFIIIEEIVISCVVGCHSGSFTESASSGRNNKCKILGHVNAMFVMLVGVLIFSLGASSSSQPGHAACLVFAIVFALLFILAIVFMVLDLLGAKLSVCYLTVSDPSAEDEEAGLLTKLKRVL